MPRELNMMQAVLIDRRRRPCPRRRRRTRASSCVFGGGSSRSPQPKLMPHGSSTAACSFTQSPASASQVWMTYDSPREIDVEARARELGGGPQLRQADEVGDRVGVIAQLDAAGGARHHRHGERAQDAQNRHRGHDLDQRVTQVGLRVVSRPDEGQQACPGVRLAYWRGVPRCLAVTTSSVGRCALCRSGTSTRPQP